MLVAAIDAGYSVGYSGKEGMLVFTRESTGAYRFYEGNDGGERRLTFESRDEVLRFLEDESATSFELGFESYLCAEGQAALVAGEQERGVELPRPLGDGSVRKLAWLGRVTCLRALGDDEEARQAARAGLDEGEHMTLRRALDELTRRQGRAISPRERRGGSAVRASIARKPLHASSS